MASHRYAVAGALSFAMILAGGGSGLPGLARTGGTHDHEQCSAGAQTLAAPGSRLYPDTGNGGYTSLHTGVHMVYDATSNRFLPGNRVTLTDRATQCLTSFSLDFERRSANTGAGPNMAVNSVTVDGKRAAFRFVQPTYPGDPHGQDDPDPLAHGPPPLDPGGGQAPNPPPPPAHPNCPPPARRRTRRTAPSVPPTSWSSRRPRRSGAARSFPSPSRTPAGRAYITTGTERPRDGSGRTGRRVTAASSPPNRSAPRTGCRSTTTRAPSRRTTSTTRSTPERRCSRTASW